MTSRTSNAQLSCAIFGSDAYEHISQITPYYLKFCFAVGVFLQVPKMASISSIKKDSISTTRDSFKDCILACKIRNCIQNFDKRKVPHDNFAQK